RRHGDCTGTRPRGDPDQPWGGHDADRYRPFTASLAKAGEIPIYRGETRPGFHRSEEHTSELQSRRDLVCRLLLEKKNFDISAAGIVSVSALDTASGLRQRITRTARAGLSDDEVKKATQANDDSPTTQKTDVAYAP